LPEVRFITIFDEDLFILFFKACLGSMVMVALARPVLKIFELKYYWKINKLEFVILFYSLILPD
jgi:hypothetical protein